MRRARTDPKVPLGTIRIPKSLHDPITLLLCDPVTGKVEYGAMNSLVERLLREWLDREIRKEKEEVKADG